MRFPYSRFIVDAERLYNDPMEEIGQGIIYKHFNGYTRSSLSAESQKRLMALWQQHQQNLMRELDDHSLLIDCHSFPAEMSTVDICIGFNDDWSRPSDEVLNMVRALFERNGYSVAFNTPYSNSISPWCGIKYATFMLEINKSTYMAEKGKSLFLDPYRAEKLACLIRLVYKTMLFA